MSKILGLDYGSKKVGVALSDDGQKVAFPKGVYPNVDPLIWEALANLMLQENVSAIVMGLPTALSGEDTETTKEARAFAENIKKHFRLPLRFEDESFTSKAVDTNGAAPPHKTDASAAALILQTFLDRNNLGKKQK
ncbi:MAG: Holliday junction resolvase RuvX [Candidatus Niyogibacteria bacterium]|nr:Holliday junction resolvase RuvX [Candidatus Niyogibacteria bacterium]